MALDGHLSCRADYFEEVRRLRGVELSLSRDRVQIIHKGLIVAPPKEVEIALYNERRQRSIGIQIPTPGKDAFRTVLPLGHRFILSLMGTPDRPGVFVAGPSSCRSGTGIAGAPTALCQSPGHHIWARIQAAAAESSKRGAIAGESPTLKGSCGDA